MRTANHSGDRQSAAITLEPVSPADREIFLEIAMQHFRELDPGFIPQPDWMQEYFDRILGNQRLSLRWIVTDGQKVGFVLFGIEDHAFLPRQNGVLYELYISPRFRRQGIARACAKQAIEEMQSHAPSKVQLEIMENNSRARALWKSLGFDKVSEHWVLRKTRA